MLKRLFSNGEGRKLFACTIGFIAALVIFAFVDMGWYVELIVYGLIYIAIGYEHIIGSIKEFKEEPFNEDFLMVIASIGAFILGEFADGTAVLILFTIGEFFEEYAEEKSENSITALTSLVPDVATVLVDGKEEKLAVDSLKIGDIVVLRAGDIFPCDGEVIEGNAYVDNSALTGESVPISRLIGDFVSSGGVVISGYLKIRIEKIAAESSAARIIELVKEAEDKKSTQERFIKKFSKVYTPVIICLAVIVAVIPSLITGEWNVWLMRALNFLVVSCPCALVISVPMAFFAGLGNGFSKGVIIKGAALIEKASKIKTVAFDKTGTLTNGQFKIKEVYPAENREEILSCAAICESCSNHSISRAILSEFKSIDASGYVFEETAGKGIKAKSEKACLYVGNRDFLTENGFNIPYVSKLGTLVFVGKNENYLGYIVIGDSVRDSAKEAVTRIKAQGIKTYMLTGDNELISKEVAESLSVDWYSASLTPEQKVDAVKAQDRESFMFVGDGINDAPILASSQIGVAMGSSTEVAISSADVIITDNDLTKVPFFISLSQKTMAIVYQNIIASIGIKALVLVLSLIMSIPIWLAIFADVGVMILAILNSLRLSLNTVKTAK